MRLLSWSKIASLFFAPTAAFTLMHCSDHNLGTPLSGSDAGASSSGGGSSSGGCDVASEPTPGSDCVQWACVNGSWAETGRTPFVAGTCPASLADGNMCTQPSDTACYGSTACTYQCADAGTYVFACDDDGSLRGDNYPCDDAGDDDGGCLAACVLK